MYFWAERRETSREQVTPKIFKEECGLFVNSVILGDIWTLAYSTSCVIACDVTDVCVSCFSFGRQLKVIESLDDPFLSQLWFLPSFIHSCLHGTFFYFYDWLVVYWLPCDESHFIRSRLGSLSKHIRGTMLSCICCTHSHCYLGREQHFVVQWLCLLIVCLL